MNQLEKLAINNQKNYDRYLRRMDESMALSTKGYIPIIAQKYHKILDIGCADGALIKNIQKLNSDAEVIGIDINAEAILKARENGINAYVKDLYAMDEYKGYFDCIIFSSVLHEFSSYNEFEPYTIHPIIKALKAANELLANDGIIIVRDGISVGHVVHQWPDDCDVMRFSPVTIKFTNKEDEKWLNRFVKEFKGIYYPVFYMNMNKNLYYEYSIIQEFLATWTWGPDSWAREINEAFCILDEKEWRQAFRVSGLAPISFTKSKEEYPKYLNDKITIYDEKGNEIFPEMTFLAILKKNKGE